MNYDPTASADRSADSSAYSQNKILARMKHLGLGDRLLTVGEVAKVLGYSSEKTVRNMRSRGYGPPLFKLPTGPIRCDPVELVAWATEEQSAATYQLTYESYRVRQQKEARAQKDRERQRRRREAERAVLKGGAEQ